MTPKTVEEAGAVTPREALAMARKTREHISGKPPHGPHGHGCAFFSLNLGDSPTATTWSDAASDIIVWHASLLLDGFSVAQVTGAERALREAARTGGDR